MYPDMLPPKLDGNKQIVDKYVKFDAMPKESALEGAAVEALAKEMPQKPDLAQMLKALLTDAGFSPTRANVQKLEAMLGQDLPATKEVISKFNQAFRLTGEDAEQGAFLVKNGMKLNFENAEILKSLANGEFRLGEQIGELAREIAALPAAPSKTAILQAFLPVATPEPAVANLPQSPAPLPAAEIFTNSPAAPISPENPAVTQNSPPLPILANSETLQILENISANPKLQMIAEMPSPQAAFEAFDAILQEASAGKFPPLAAFVRDENAAFALVQRVFADAPEVAEKLIPQLREVFQQEIVKQITSQFTLDIFAPENTAELVNNLRAAILVAAPEISTSPQLVNLTENILMTTDFLGNITEISYMHLPLLINSQELSAELFVFKDGRNGGKTGGNSALISLDLLNLGLVEAYIQRADKSINCQFRLNLESTGEIIRKNIEMLAEGLRGKGFSLAAISYRHIDEAFVLTNREPDDAPPRVYNFDTRA
ncbi:MAG: hypothetical protein FWB71_07265 [Defluviitaleaceae bacterium]|nr:hypothetical protein [Defluviitaleaceae bacterium]